MSWHKPFSRPFGDAFSMELTDAPISGGAPVTAVELLQGPVSASGSATFSAIPEDGELILIVSSREGSATTQPIIDGFTSLFYSGSAVNELRVQYRYADSEASAVYVVTAAAAQSRVFGYRFAPGAAISMGGSNTAASVTEMDSSAAAVDMLAGSIAVATRNYGANQEPSAAPVGWAGYSILPAAGSNGVAHRLYADAAPSQNALFTWTGSAATVRGTFIVVEPA